MQISVYQIQVEKVKDGKQIEVKDRKCYFNKIGVVTGKKENIEPEIIWELTNHIRWNNKKDETSVTFNECMYKPVKYDTGFTNDDIFFRYNNKWWCADQFGWTQVRTIKEAKQYVFENGSLIKSYLPEEYKFENIISRK